MEENNLINYYKQKVEELEEKYDELDDYVCNLSSLAHKIARNYELLKQHTIFKNISVKDFCEKFYKITGTNISVNTFYKILRDKGILKKKKGQINQPRVGYAWWFDTIEAPSWYKHADSIKVLTDEGQRGIFEILCQNFGYGYLDYFDTNYNVITYLKKFEDEYDPREI